MLNCSMGTWMFGDGVVSVRSSCDHVRRKSTLVLGKDGVTLDL